MKGAERSVAPRVAVATARLGKGAAHLYANEQKASPLFNAECCDCFIDLFASFTLPLPMSIHSNRINLIPLVSLMISTGSLSSFEARNNLQRPISVSHAIYCLFLSPPPRDPTTTFSCHMSRNAALPCFHNNDNHNHFELG